MTDCKPVRSVGVLTIAAGLFGLVGALRAIPFDEAMSNKAFHLPVMVALVAIVGIGTGVALLRGHSWARISFFVCIPPLLLGIGSVFPSVLWRADIPYTMLGALLYTPTCFVMTRGRTQSTNGFVPLLILSLVALVGILWVAFSPVHEGGPPWPGFSHHSWANNRWVCKHASLLVLCAHYWSGALVALVKIQPKSRVATAIFASLAAVVPIVVFLLVKAIGGS